MLLGTVGVSLLGNMLAGKGIVSAGSGNKNQLFKQCVGTFALDSLILCQQEKNTSMFSPNNFKKNDSIILIYFKYE